jgi:integrase/recombinase XerD
VDTKFGKTFDTFFFPVGGEIKDIISSWVTFLREELLWSETDPLFPSTRMQLDHNRLFTASGLSREHWKDAGPIRRIFKDAFIKAGLPYFNPHSFRNTLALLAGNMCKTPGEYKAWSQNLGHENVLTTFTSYGNIPTSQQGTIIRDLARSSVNDDFVAIQAVEALLSKMKRQSNL